MRTLCFGQLLLCGAVVAAEPLLQKDPDRDRHRIGVQVPIWLRAQGRFVGFQTSDFGENNGVGTISRSYIDGYNNIDITGNAVAPEPPARYSFNRTSNFKFMSMSQVNNDTNPNDGEDVDPNGGTLALHGIAVSGGAFARNRNTDVLPGVEVFYRYHQIERSNWALDWELGAAVQQFEWNISHSLPSVVSVITDIFPLGGVVLRPINAGEEGAFEDETGRRPVIGSVPQRSVSRSSGTIVGKHELNMDAVQLRLGPALSWQPHTRLNFDALAGLSVGFNRTEYHFVNRAVQDVSVNGAPLSVAPQTGEITDSSVTYGLYSAVRGTWRFTEHWDAHAEVRHIWQEAIRLDAPLGTAEVNLSDGLALVLGISRRF